MHKKNRLAEYFCLFGETNTIDLWNIQHRLDFQCDILYPQIDTNDSTKKNQNVKKKIRNVFTKTT
jgi:hypothetical protein